MIHNHIIEASFATVLACLAFGGWILVTSWPPLPREKPEEFVMPPVEYVEPASQEQMATARARPTNPLPEQESEQKQITVDELLKKAERINEKLDGVSEPK